MEVYFKRKYPAIYNPVEKQPCSKWNIKEKKGN